MGEIRQALFLYCIVQSVCFGIGILNLMPQFKLPGDTHSWQSKKSSVLPREWQRCVRDIKTNPLEIRPDRHISWTPARPLKNRENREE